MCTPCSLGDVQNEIEVLVDGAPTPRYARPGDAGVDLSSAESLTLAPGERRLVGTGLRIALPHGHVGLVTPRSGLAAKHGITIVNAPGIIDAGYRGEIKVALLNTDAEKAHEIAAGDRIAQLIVLPFPLVTFTPVAELPGSERAESGFGSTGLGAHESRD